MKKNLSIIIITFVLLIVISTCVNASEKITTTDIHNAVNNNDNVEIILEDDIYLESTVVIPEGKNVTLDLNGKQITVKKNGERSLYAIDNYGELTLKDSVGNGTITARGIENLPGGTMKIESGKIISCDSNGGAAIWNEANLTINGGTFETAYVGTPSDSVGAGCLNNSGGVTVVNGGAFQSVNRRTYAIISTGEIQLNNNPIVTGAHGGLAIDAGVATVDGGKYSSTEYYGLYVSNDGMGAESEGARVTVNGGEFTGKKYSVWIGSDVNNPVNSTIVITGGKFNNPLNVQNNVVESAGIKVKGGQFVEDVTDYMEDVGDDYVQYILDGIYYVAKLNEIIIEENENGTVQASLDKAIVGQSIEITIDPNDGYKIGSVRIYDEKGNEINVINNTFIMPDSKVNIKVNFESISAKDETTQEEPAKEEVEEKESIKEDSKEKDETPKTGTKDIIFYVCIATGVISLVGTVKSRTGKHSK